MGCMTALEFWWLFLRPSDVALIPEVVTGTSEFDKRLEARVSSGILRGSKSPDYHKGTWEG